MVLTYLYSDAICCSATGSRCGLTAERMPGPQTLRYGGSPYPRPGGHDAHGPNTSHLLQLQENYVVYVGLVLEAESANAVRAEGSKARPNLFTN